MYNLEYEIGRWRGTMASGGVGDPGVLNELEGHLREHIDQQVRAGVDQMNAFESGVRRIGEPKALQREFSRAEGFIGIVWTRHRWFAPGLSLFAGMGFFLWQAAVAPGPLYEGTTTIEIQGLSQMSADNGILGAEALNTAVHLLSRNRVQGTVADSFSQAEQQVLLRPFPTKSFAHASSKQVLGELAVRLMRQSFLVLISVRHRDAHAAALLANRYAAEWQKELANSSNLKSISLRVVDPAIPATRPISPNYRTIGMAALAVSGVTFLGLMLARVLLKKLAPPRAEHPRYVSSS